MASSPDQPESGQKKSWFNRLKDGLTRSSTRLTDGITGIFTKRKLDDETLEELEDLLIGVDLGPTNAAQMTAELARTRFGKDITPEEVREALADQAAAVLEKVAIPLRPEGRPSVILMVGVNGSGKTTTIGKLAHLWQAQGLSVVMAAGDTFRAAAVEQLKIWGERTGAPVVSRPIGADAAGLAFDAYETARRDGADVLLIDTAGRLQNKKTLMEELAKVVRVLKKQDPSIPHHVVLVLDATTGQNAHSQVEAFLEAVNVTGLIVTKLDGTARGGVVVSLAQSFGLPVHAVGVGESAEDLQDFDPRQFARSLMGLGS
jgi:fused signal recognition particle receptor